MLIEKLQPRPFDERRDLIVPGDYQKTIIFCVEHFIAISKQAIKDHGAFFVALSGGSTPKAIFELLSSPPYDQMTEWNKFHLFWSDERAVPPDHPDSNYRMAMKAGLEKMPIPKEQIHRMRAEEEIEKNASAYEQEIGTILKESPFDLLMLGMGEDGHTASLFPGTQGLHVEGRNVIANFVPKANAWRMTFTFPFINQALKPAIYILGDSKKETLAEVLLSPNQFDRYPVQRVGTPSRHALLIADESAASTLILRKDPKSQTY